MASFRICSIFAVLVGALALGWGTAEADCISTGPPIVQPAGSHVEAARIGPYRCDGVDYWIYTYLNRPGSRLVEPATGNWGGEGNFKTRDQAMQAMKLEISGAQLGSYGSIVLKGPIFDRWRRGLMRPKDWCVSRGLTTNNDGTESEHCVCVRDQKSQLGFSAANKRVVFTDVTPEIVCPWIKAKTAPPRPRAPGNPAGATGISRSAIDQMEMKGGCVTVATNNCETTLGKYCTPPRQWCGPLPPGQDNGCRNVNIEKAPFELHRCK